MTIDPIGLCSCGGTIWRRPTRAQYCDDCNTNILFVGLNTWWVSVKLRWRQRKLTKKLERQLESARYALARNNRIACEARYRHARDGKTMEIASGNETVLNETITTLKKALEK